MGGFWSILGGMSEIGPQVVSMSPPRERRMGRDRFQEVAFWVLGLFLAGQLALMAWLDLR